MKSRLMLCSTIIVLGTVLAACASTTPTPAAVATQASAPVTTQAVAAPATQAVAAPATQPAAAAAGGIAVADSAKGKILVDGNGMTLYIYTKDSANTSNCSGACSKNWPALAAVLAANVGAGVDASLLASITRADGTSQATYKGMPLYTFTPDTKAGDLNGQGKGGVWYVITATGTIINP